MIKKRNLLILLIVMILFPTNAFADTASGPALLVSPKYYPEYDKYMAFFDKNAVTHIVHRWYSDSSYTTTTMETNFYSPNSDGAVFDGVFNWNCKNRYMETIFYNANEQQVGFVRIYTDSIVQSKCTSGPFPLDSDDQQQYSDFISKYGNSGSCDVCQMFSCPGWSQFMSGLQDIRDAIPPAPNWQIVAGTFRDTIAPRIISDLGDLLGSTYEPPSAPVAPSTPELPSDLDNHGITPPTGQEDPNLGKSTFDSNDLKNAAPLIQERQDPTGGGFSILDPVGGLPSQDDFKKNKPNEGSADLPDKPKEPENVAPKPPNSDNVAPKPTEGSNTAPKPKDQGNTAPKPSDGNNTAPIPGGTGGGYDTPPKPSDSGGTAPLPNDSGTAPIPKETWEPPIPGNP